MLNDRGLIIAIALLSGRWRVQPNLGNDPEWWKKPDARALYHECQGSEGRHCDRRPILVPLNTEERLKPWEEMKPDAIIAVCRKHLVSLPVRYPDLFA